jgi:hypothetical protein
MCTVVVCEGGARNALHLRRARPKVRLAMAHVGRLIMDVQSCEGVARNAALAGAPRCVWGGNGARRHLIMDIYSRV